MPYIDQIMGCTSSEGLSERATTAAVSFLRLIRLGNMADTNYIQAYQFVWCVSTLVANQHNVPSPCWYRFVQYEHSRTIITMNEAEVFHVNNRFL